MGITRKDIYVDLWMRDGQLQESDFYVSEEEKIRTDSFMAVKEFIVSIDEKYKPTYILIFADGYIEDWEDLAEKIDLKSSIGSTIICTDLIQTRSRVFKKIRGDWFDGLYAIESHLKSDISAVEYLNDMMHDKLLRDHNYPDAKKLVPGEKFGLVKFIKEEIEFLRDLGREDRREYWYAELVKKTAHDCLYQ